MVLSAVIALSYYCYRKKSKGRQVAGQTGLFGRMGFRARHNNLHQTNQAMQNRGTYNNSVCNQIRFQYITLTSSYMIYNVNSKKFGIWLGRFVRPL